MNTRICMMPEKCNDPSKDEMLEKIEILENAILKIDTRKGELSREADSLQKTVSQEQNIIKDLKEKILQIQQDLRSDSDNKDLGKLKKLVDMNEKMKKADLEFREKSKLEYEELESKHSKMRDRLEQITSKTPAKDSKEDLMKLDELRAKCREIDAAESEADKMLDSVATKADLVRFQKKFIQLHQQVSAKQVETMNYFDMYNNLCDQKKFLEREITLLSSMQDSLPDFKGSEANKLSYYNKLEDLLSAVLKAQSSCQDRLTEQQKIKSVHDKEKEELMAEKKRFNIMVEEVQNILKK